MLRRMLIALMVVASHGIADFVSHHRRWTAERAADFDGRPGLGRCRHSRQRQASHAQSRSSRTEGARFSRFYAGPVCTPTRASLMTGRYHPRTTRSTPGVAGPCLIRTKQRWSKCWRRRVIAPECTGNGISAITIRPPRSIRDSANPSFTGAAASDSPPTRQKATATSIPAWSTTASWFSKLVTAQDVFTDAAIHWVDAGTAPLLVYLAFNVPHVPLEVADALDAPHRDAGLDEPTARLYAMMSNLDANIGRMLPALEQRRLANDTLVIFLFGRCVCPAGRMSDR